MSIKRVVVVLLVSTILCISCNDQKPNEKAPVLPEEELPEKMPMQKLDADSNSTMPVVPTPDSTASMPNGYKPPSATQ